MNNATILIAGLVVAGGVGYYLYTKEKDPTGTMLMGDTGEPETFNGGSQWQQGKTKTDKDKIRDILKKDPFNKDKERSVLTGTATVDPNYVSPKNKRIALRPKFTELNNAIKPSDFTRWIANRFAYYHPDVLIGITPTGHYGKDEPIITSGFRAKRYKIESWDVLYNMWKDKMYPMLTSGSGTLRMVRATARNEMDKMYEEKGIKILPNGTMTFADFSGQEEFVGIPADIDDTFALAFDGGEYSGQDDLL